MADKRLADDVGAMAFVQSARLCAGLPESGVKQLIDSGLIAEFDADQVIVREGDANEDLYMIIDGSVVLQRGEEVVATLERQGIFGEAGALTGQPHQDTAVATIEVRLVRFPGAVVREVAESAPSLGRRLAALMASRD